MLQALNNTHTEGILAGDLLRSAMALAFDDINDFTFGFVVCFHLTLTLNMVQFLRSYTGRKRWISSCTCIFHVKKKTSKQTTGRNKQEAFGNTVTTYINIGDIVLRSSNRINEAQSNRPSSYISSRNNQRSTNQQPLSTQHTSNRMNGVTQPRVPLPPTEAEPPEDHLAFISFAGRGTIPARVLPPPGTPASDWCHEMDGRKGLPQVLAGKGMAFDKNYQEAQVVDLNYMLSKSFTKASNITDWPEHVQDWYKLRRDEALYYGMKYPSLTGPLMKKGHGLLLDGTLVREKRKCIGTLGAVAIINSDAGCRKYAHLKMWQKLHERLNQLGYVAPPQKLLMLCHNGYQVGQVDNKAAVVPALGGFTEVTEVLDSLAISLCHSLLIAFLAWTFMLVCLGFVDNLTAHFPLI